MNNADFKLITCVLPKGVALPVLESVDAAFGRPPSNINSARGIGKITPLKYRGLGDQAEKEILSIMIETSRADELFEFIYLNADLNRPHGGLMYVQPLGRSSQFELPDLPSEQ